MPSHTDPIVRGDDVVAAVHTLVARGGVRAVTYRAVARLVDLSVSSLHENFPDKSQMFNIATYHLSLRRLHFFGGATGIERLHRMVPETPTQLHLAVIWLALRDHGRIEPMLAYTLHEAEQAELSLIRRALSEAGVEDPSRAAVDATAALIEGLASRRTVGETPLSHLRSCAALDAVLSAWGVAADDDAAA